MQRFASDHRAWTRGTAALLALTSLVGVAYLVLAVAPDLLSHTKGLDAKARIEERQGIRTAALAFLAGLIAFIGAIYTARSFSLNQSGQITERFTRAIDQLGRPELELRLGGIYALERIARDSAADHGPVMEVLTAYLREHARSEPSVDLDEETTDRLRRRSPLLTSPSPRPPADVEAVMAVLRRRKDSARRSSHVLDLSGTDLRGANLEEVDLRGANLEATSFLEARLTGARLTGCNLSRAQLDGAECDRVDFEGANLLRAQLRFASLRGASLRGAELRWARLDGAHLEGAQLDFANLRGAHLDGVWFRSSRAGPVATGLDTVNLFKILGEARWPPEFDHVVAATVNRRDDKQWLARFRSWHPGALDQVREEASEPLGLGPSGGSE